MDKPYSDITFAGVFWQEEKRLPLLLKYVRPWFANIVVGVQKGGDLTADFAYELANKVVLDVHHGFAEPTFTKVLGAISTPWTMVISGDEKPSPDLLDSLGEMLEFSRLSNEPQVDAFRIRFHSTIDGIDFTGEQDCHIRVFKTKCSWPTTMHSEPRVERPVYWDTGYVDHDRSLDEMIVDYLSYYHRGLGDAGWDKHNRMMMRGACGGVAGPRGWAYVKSFGWWAEVASVAYEAEGFALP